MFVRCLKEHTVDIFEQTLLGFFQGVLKEMNKNFPYFQVVTLFYYFLFSSGEEKTTTNKQKENKPKINNKKPQNYIDW